MSDLTGPKKNKKTAQERLADRRIGYLVDEFLSSLVFGDDVGKTSPDFFDTADRKAVRDIIEKELNIDAQIGGKRKKENLLIDDEKLDELTDGFIAKAKSKAAEYVASQNKEVIQFEGLPEGFNVGVVYKRGEDGKLEFVDIDKDDRQHEVVDELKRLNPSLKTKDAVNQAKVLVGVLDSELQRLNDLIDQSRQETDGNAERKDGGGLTVEEGVRADSEDLGSIEIFGHDIEALCYKVGKANDVGKIEIFEEYKGEGASNNFRSLLAKENLLRSVDGGTQIIPVKILEGENEAEKPSCRFSFSIFNKTPKRNPKTRRELPP
jgi:fructose-specific component phosphotransferase system IIB-like protein